MPNYFRDCEIFSLSLYPNFKYNKVMNKFIRENDFVEYGKYSEFSYCGIYCITCRINNIKYIGSTNDIGRRLSKHFSELRNNRHTNSRLQEDYNKYGIDSFEIECLEKTTDLIKREIYYQLHFGIDNIYNEKISGVWMSDNLKEVYAGSSKETHKTKEYRDKMSKMKSNKICKYILLIDNQGHYIHKDLEVFENMEELILKYPNYKPQVIRGVCNGSKKSAYKFQWKYIDDDGNQITNGRK